MRGSGLEALDMTATHVPHYFRCPISLDLMVDPVTVSTGQTYDRSSIESWFSTGNSTCPVTNATLTNRHVIPNHTLRRLIQDWCPSSGLTRIPTPTRPADPALVRSLLAQISAEPTRSAALGRLGRLLAESEKNREVAASCDAAGTLVRAAFATRETARGSVLVLSRLALGEAECAYVGSDPDRVGRLVSLLFDESAEVRVDSAAVVEMVVSGTRSAEVRTRIVESDGIFEGVVGIVSCPFSSPRATRVGIRTLLALCLVRSQRHRAVAAGAVPALIGKMTDLEKHDAERALAVAELLCRTTEGSVAFAAHALTMPVLAKALLRVSERATEFAAGALLAVCVASEECRREAVAAGVVARVLLVVQSKCTERAKRKAQALLKLLKDSWPEHCQMGSSDDQYYGCSAVVPF